METFRACAEKDPSSDVVFKSPSPLYCSVLSGMDLVLRFVKHCTQFSRQSDETNLDGGFRRIMGFFFSAYAKFFLLCRFLPKSRQVQSKGK